MKNKSLLLIAGFAAILFSTSCKHEEVVENKTGPIDSLQTVLVNYDKLFKEINVTEVENITYTITADIDSAYDVCEKKKLTLTEDEGTFFGRYQALKSGLKKFGTRYNDIKEALEYSKNQLASLKTDVAADKFDHEAAQKYVADEATALKNLGNAVEQIHGASVTVTGQFKTYRPQYLQMLQNIVSKK